MEVIQQKVRTRERDYRLNPGLFIGGIAMLGISLFILLLRELFPQITEISEWNFVCFFLSYSLTGIYLVTILVTWWMSGKILYMLPYKLVCLLLWIISGYALNRQIAIFEQPVPWLSGLLLVQGIGMLLLSMRDHLRPQVQYVLFAILGTTVLLHFYFVLYMLPILGYGLLGSILFGIGAHAFIPYFFLYYSIKILIRAHEENRRYVYSFLLGIGLAVCFCTYFVIRWNQVKNRITYGQNEAITNYRPHQLPAWAVVGQRLDADWITERVLKHEIVYQTPDNVTNFGRAGMSKMDEAKQHDPLVMIAYVFAGKPAIAQDDKLKILEFMFGARHKTREKLWSGRNLETSNVITHARIFPQYRMAYTEKIVTIHLSQYKRRWWGTQQEALYTFHVPEGAVVSSASLWINGKEEPAYLTTKHKADSAYKSVVGVERRDPVVVHWQEGNTVTVRVFPCTTAEDRRFKIGITSPLRLDDDKLVYENIRFEGHPAARATESIRLEFDRAPADLDLPFSFDEDIGHVCKYEGSYTPDWEVTLKAPALAETAFVFNNQSYHLADYQKQYESFDAADVYLDINKSWSEDDLEQVWEAVKGKNVYVFYDELIKVTEEDKDQLFEVLRRLNFSIFPVQLIKHPGRSLLITRGAAESPNLSDLKKKERTATVAPIMMDTTMAADTDTVLVTATDTMQVAAPDTSVVPLKNDFTSTLVKFLAERPSIRVFNLGREVSPFLKTLKEMRVFRYDQGNSEELASLVKQRQFVASQETGKTVVIEHSRIRIDKAPSNGTTTAKNTPDHLLRLFAYNDIMKKAAPNYFRNDYISPELVDEATQANIVSPVSSLIVLETQEDYQRFGIEKSKNSVGNASMKSSGAVPEPHEWLLIILTVTVVSYMLLKSYAGRLID